MVYLLLDWTWDTPSFLAGLALGTATVSTLAAVAFSWLWTKVRELREDLETLESEEG